MLKLVVIALTAALGAGLVTYLPLHSSLTAALAEAQELKSVVKSREAQLLGHTSYTTFLTVGKQSLAGQMKLLTAIVTREEGVTQVVQRNFLPGLSSSATVAIWYEAQYSFGFNLQPDQYDLVAVPTGIQIRVKKPTLVASPSVQKLRYRVLDGGTFVDGNAALLKLTEQALSQSTSRGATMATDPAILALCEKKLVEFLHSFLAKQPGVKVVPYITVLYT